MLQSDYNSITLIPTISNIKSRKDVQLFRTFYNRNNNEIVTCIPIIAANMREIGTPHIARELTNHGLLTALYKDYNEHATEYSFISSGIDGDNLYFHHLINLDIANGYLVKFHDTVRNVRKAFPNSFIMAGNVVDYNGAKALYEAGADVVKVGIGPGLACTTREKTGVGRSQVDAVKECKIAANHYYRYICADGGCRTPGDVVKAFALGADFVMIGGMFAGHDECMYDDLQGSSTYDVPEYATLEGKRIKAQNRGPIEGTIKDILGGLRSAMAYLNTPSITALSDGTVEYEYV